MHRPLLCLLLAPATLSWHRSASESITAFSVAYAKRGMLVLDIGGRSINGGAREVFEAAGCKFTAMDIAPDPSIDVVVTPGDRFPFSDAAFDLVIATSTFEHDPEFWMTIREMARVTRLSGHIYVNSPSKGPHHAAPGDNWRFYRDSAAALARWSGRSVSGMPAWPLRVVEQYFAYSERDLAHGDIHSAMFDDCVMIWQRTSEPATNFVLAAAELRENATTAAIAEGTNKAAGRARAASAARNGRGRSARSWGLCNGSVLLDAEQLLVEKGAYWRNGYVIVRELFSPVEVSVVKDVVQAGAERRAHPSKLRHRLQRPGAHLSFDTHKAWNDVTGPDVFAKLGRSYKILDRLSCYYEDDVYGYQNELVGTPGFRPHQDHSHWQKFGVRYPDTSAVHIAIDHATRANGCMQIVERSHLLGTLPHGNWTPAVELGLVANPDNGVEPSHWKMLVGSQGYVLTPLPLEPGDAIFFHGNTIHAMDDNLSDESRVAMIATMNTRRNRFGRAKNLRGHSHYRHQARVYAEVKDADRDLPLPHSGPASAQVRRGGLRAALGSPIPGRAAQASTITGP